MADTSSPVRVDPILDSQAAPPRAVEDLIAAVETTPHPAPTASAPLSVDMRLDQLSRIEDKVARIEEKYARTEASMLRVGDKVDATVGRMGEVASQVDLTALREEVGGLTRRVRGLPGTAALMLTALVTALLTAAITLAVMKYMPGVLAR